MIKQITINDIKEIFTKDAYNMTNNQLAGELVTYLFTLAHYKAKDGSDLSKRVGEIYRDRAIRLYDKLDALGYYDTVKEGNS